MLGKNVHVYCLTVHYIEVSVDNVVYVHVYCLTVHYLEVCV